MENPKIILINLSFPFSADDKTQLPTGLMSLAASLETKRIKVRIEDFSGKLNWEKEATKFQTETSGVACVTSNFPIVKKIAELLSSKSLKIIGGVYPIFKVCLTTVGQELKKNGI